MGHPRAARPRVLLVNWRDTGHPEGGGSERYVHRVAEGLAARGLTVEMFCAAHDRAPAEDPDTYGFGALPEPLRATAHRVP